MIASLAISLVSCIIGFIFGSIFLGILLAVFFVFQLIYVYLIRHRIDFAAVLLETTGFFIKEFPATIVVTFGGFIVCIGWYICAFMLTFGISRYYDVNGYGAVS